MTSAPYADINVGLPPTPARIHFIGIGGVSMSGLATMLADSGYTVSGSDAVESPTVSKLRQQGVEVVIGHDDPTLASRADVVVSTRRAELRAEAEVAAAAANGALIVKRGQLLGLIANPRRTLAVAGSHGKSTTSGMLAHALTLLGHDPGFAVGATLPGQAGNTVMGAGQAMVVEADEFDRSLLWLRPSIAVITSVSFDHPDIFADQADYDATFVAFARQVKPGGTLIIAAEDPGCRRVLDALGERENLSFSIVTFGQNAVADWRLEPNDGAWVVYPRNALPIRAAFQAPGAHNARNAVAAGAALHAFGIAPDQAIRAIEPFSGVGRRFEHKGTAAGVDVVDDYAHHPEEIAAVVDAARMHFPGRRVVVVHQPHTFSRTRILLDQFAEALDLADHVVLLEIYPGGETDSLGISTDDLLSRIHVPAQAVAGPEAAAAKVAALARTGDVVLTLGAGDITRTGDLVLQHLAARDQGEPLRQRRKVNGPDAFEVPGVPGLKVMPNASMAMFTTMRLGGPADFLIRTPKPEDVAAAMRWAAAEGLPVTVIGGGSNLLIGDGGIRGLVMVARTPGERAAQLVEVEERDDVVRVTVGAQAPLSWIGRYCAEHGWAGMDWGVGLPGQIGGATVNNAGAHGTELKDHLVAIDVLDSNGEIERLPAAWLDATYRMTRIKEAIRPRPWTVLRSVFDLVRHDPAVLMALADAHAAFRKRTQPTGACSGSTFANPEGDFAGRLLEAAGLKGHRQGAMQLSPKHANWVVNTGGGSASEAWALIQHAQETVRSRFGVLLRPEIERLGEPWDDDGMSR